MNLQLISLKKSHILPQQNTTCITNKLKYSDLKQDALITIYNYVSKDGTVAVTDDL